MGEAGKTAFGVGFGRKGGGGGKYPVHGGEFPRCQTFETMPFNGAGKRIEILVIDHGKVKGECIETFSSGRYRAFPFFQPLQVVTDRAWTAKEPVIQQGLQFFAEGKIQKQGSGHLKFHAQRISHLEIQALVLFSGQSGILLPRLGVWKLFIFLRIKEKLDLKAWLSLLLGLHPVGYSDTGPGGYGKQLVCVSLKHGKAVDKSPGDRVP